MTQLAMLLPVSPEPAARVPGATIIRAGEEHEPAIARVLAEAFPGERWDEERVRRELTRADDVLAVFGAEVDGEIVATASAREHRQRFPGQGYVHWVGASPARSGRGLGRAVVGEVLAYFARKGLAPVVLETDDERLPAIVTYLALGFVPLYLDDDHPARWSAVFRAIDRHRAGRG